MTTTATATATNRDALEASIVLGIRDAHRGAVARLIALGWTPARIGEHADQLATRCREELRRAMPEALADADDAVAVGAHALAVATFSASCALAGIEAANGLHADTTATVVAVDPDALAVGPCDAFGRALTLAAND